MLTHVYTCVLLRMLTRAHLHTQRALLSECAGGLLCADLCCVLSLLGCERPLAFQRLSMPSACVASHVKVSRVKGWLIL